MNFPGVNAKPCDEPQRYKRQDRHAPHAAKPFPADEGWNNGQEHRRKRQPANQSLMRVLRRLEWINQKSAEKDNRYQRRDLRSGKRQNGYRAPENAIRMHEAG